MEVAGGDKKFALTTEFRSTFTLKSRIRTLLSPL